jgi:hypothetical protein
LLSFRVHAPPRRGVAYVDVVADARRIAPALR